MHKINHGTFYFRDESEESIGAAKNEFLNTQESSIRFVDELVQQAEEALRKIREENKKYVSNKRQSSEESANMQEINGDPQENKELETVYYREGVDNDDDDQDILSISSASSNELGNSRELPTISEKSETDSEIEEDLRNNTPVSEIDKESDYNYLGMTDEEAGAVGDSQNIEDKRKTCTCGPVKNKEKPVEQVNNIQNTEEDKKKTCSCGPVKSREKPIEPVSNIQNTEEGKRKLVPVGL